MQELVRDCDFDALLAAAFNTYTDRTSLIGRNVRMSYGELDREADAFARALGMAGLRPGDRVACSLPNHPRLVTAFLGTLRAGGIWLGINRALAAGEKVHILADSGARVLFADLDCVTEITPHLARLPSLERIFETDPSAGEEAWHRFLAASADHPAPTHFADPHAPAVLAYTSGTTGHAKAVVHSRYNLALALMVRLSRPWSLTDRHGVCTPMTIVNLMIVGPLAMLASGGTTVCMDTTYAPAIADWVERERVHSLSAASAIFHDMLVRPDIASEKTRSLKAISMGSAHVPDDFRLLFDTRFGENVTYAYGLTEAPTVVASTQPGVPFARGSVGRPLPHLEVRLLDREGREVLPGEEGEICLSAAREGPWARLYRPMLGYWNQPEMTAEALRGGVLHTGDLGRFSPQGDLFVTGRLKDMINRGGANVYPAEIERVLDQDPAVLYCAVTGKPDARLGETVAAFIQLAHSDEDRNVVTERLRALCSNELAAYKVPADWIFVDEMPRNDMKKIVKAKLRRHYFTEGEGISEAAGFGDRQRATS